MLNTNGEFCALDFKLDPIDKIIIDYDIQKDGSFGVEVEGKDIMVKNIVLNKAIVEGMDITNHIRTLKKRSTDTNDKIDANQDNKTTTSSTSTNNERKQEKSSKQKVAIKSMTVDNEKVDKKQSIGMLYQIETSFKEKAELNKKRRISRFEASRMATAKSASTINVKIRCPADRIPYLYIKGLTINNLVINTNQDNRLSLGITNSTDVKMNVNKTLKNLIQNSKEDQKPVGIIGVHSVPLCISASVENLYLNTPQDLCLIPKSSTEITIDHKYDRSLYQTVFIENSIRGMTTKLNNLQEHPIMSITTNPLDRNKNIEYAYSLNTEGINRYKFSLNNTKNNKTTKRGSIGGKLDALEREIINVLKSKITDDKTLLALENKFPYIQTVLSIFLYNFLNSCFISKDLMINHQREDWETTYREYISGPLLQHIAMLANTLNIPSGSVISDPNLRRIVNGLAIQIFPESQTIAASNRFTKRDGLYKSIDRGLITTVSSAFEKVRDGFISIA